MKVGIVGGGLGGLMTAVLLAQRGAQVTVLERARALGGRARTDDEDGFLFNQGPHAIYRGGASEALLKRLGVGFSGGAPKVKGWALYQGRAHTFPAGPLSLLTTGLFDARGRWEAARLFAGVSRLEAEGDETAGAFVDRTVSHPGLRSLLLMLLRTATYTHPAGALRARDALVQLKMAVDPGVAYLDGGWQTLVDGLTARGRAAGVTIGLGASVERVIVEGGRATGIAVDGEALSFDAVVLACGPKMAHKLAPEDTAIARGNERAEPVEAACLDVALERPTKSATVLFGVDEPYYASMHSAAANLVRPARAGGAVVHLAKYLAPGDTCTEGELRAYLDRLQPDARVVRARFLPKMVVMNARLDADLGGLDGRIRTPDTAGLGLVGDWVGDTGMLLDAVAASAEAAADAVKPMMAKTA